MFFLSLVVDQIDQALLEVEKGVEVAARVSVKIESKLGL